VLEAETDAWILNKGSQCVDLYTRATICRPSGVWLYDDAIRMVYT
jgi:hypothetical protein